MYLDFIKNENIPMEKYFLSKEYRRSWDGHLIGLRNSIGRKIDRRQGVQNNFKKIRRP